MRVNRYLSIARPARAAVAGALCLLLLRLVFFAVSQPDAPPAISDRPEGLSIEFSVDQRALLFLESCVSGRWAVSGAAAGIRFNGGSWDAAPAGDYRLCNRSSLSPTLEVRLPSTAIARYQLEVPVLFGDGFHVAVALLLVGCALYAAGLPRWPQRRLLLLIGGAHGGLALLYSLTTELSIFQFARWGQSFHNLPMADLRHNLLETFLHLHSQPPLFSAYGIALNTIFGESYEGVSYALHVALGIAMCCMAYVMLWQLLGSRSAAFCTAMLLALHPALFLYEAFAHYTLLAAFWALAAGFCLLLYQQRGRNRYLALFALCVTLLILTRSVYHSALLLPALLLISLLARRKRRRLLLGCILISLLAFGWYGKNLLLYGSFSTSTWLGMSLWRIARADYNAEELVALYHADVLNSRPVIWSTTFLRPSEYGLDPSAASDIVILSGDNANNLAYIDLNLPYRDNALRLLRHDLGRYLRGALRAFSRYACPSATWENLQKNVDAMPASHHALSNHFFHMQGAAQQLGRALGFARDGIGACSNLFFLIPLLSLALPLYALARCRARWACWRDLLRREALLVYLWAAVAYTALATSLLEIGDNARFKFMSEFPLWILIAVLGYRLWRRLLAATSVRAFLAV